MIADLLVAALDWVEGRKPVFMPFRTNEERHIAYLHKLVDYDAGDVRKLYWRVHAGMVFQAQLFPTDDIDGMLCYRPLTEAEHDQADAQLRTGVSAVSRYAGAEESEGQSQRRTA